MAAVLALTGTVPLGAHAADLTSLSLEQLLEVKVVGASKYEQDQREVAAAVSVITRAEIQAFGWRTIDEALASLPGVYTTYDRQYVYLGTRGFAVPGDYSTRVLLTVNGNRYNDPAYDVAPMGHQLPIDLDLVERIEFIPGPGSAVYGQNAMFGVVNIVTRSGADVGGAEVAVRWRNPQAARELRASWGGRLDNGVDLLLSASALRSRGEDRFYDFGAAGVSGVAAGLDGERDREFFARAMAQHWSFDLAYGRRRKDDPTGSFLSDPLVAGQYQRDDYLLTQAQYQDTITEYKLDLLGRVFYGEQAYRSMLVYGTPIDFPADSRWHGFELRLLSLAFADHKVMFGVEAQQSHQAQSVDDHANPANSVVITGPGWRGGVYVQDEWQLTPAVGATLGLRVDRNHATGTTYSPRAALIWQASAATTAKALLGRAHRAPNSGERDYDDGVGQVANPTLSGERVQTAEAVLDHRIAADFAVRASLYRWTMHNLITLGIDPVSGLPQYQSGERVQARGLELSADKTWPHGARLRGSVSWQRVGYDDAELLNSPRLLGRLNASTPLPFGGLRAAYEWRYDAARLALQDTRLGGYAVSALALSTGALARGLDVALRIDNLFDKRYAQPGADNNWQTAFEQDGRSVRLQAVLRF